MPDSIASAAQNPLEGEKRMSEESFLKALASVDSAKRDLAPSMSEMESADYLALDAYFNNLRTQIELYRKKYFPNHQL